MAGFKDTDVVDQDGKTFFITGGNSGLGFETAKVLASRNARVIIGCRNAGKAKTAIDTIERLYPSADVKVVSIDLADIDSIKLAAIEVKKESRLDVLINNAGIMVPPLEHTVQGFESQFGVNHLGPFALTSLLLDKLAETPGARVINTSSLAHQTGSINFNDINAEKFYNAGVRYSQSKLANLLFSNELQRRLSKAGSSTLSIACHPGIADTALFRHLSPLVQYATPFFRMFINTSAQGAWPTLKAATDSSLTGGEYCGPNRIGEGSGPAGLARSSYFSKDKALAKRLWNLSIEMTGIDPGI